MATRAATGVLPHQFAQIELVDDFNDKARQVIFGQPFVHRGRQKVSSVSVNRYEPAHRAGLLWSTPAIVAPYPASRKTGKPDRLLGRMRNWLDAAADDQRPGPQPDIKT